ncbi:MAG: DUF4149 domain-containing protein [Nitrospirae bacterium]|nr:DUF4149 domain-containing protein [Nitrospirota bacterium]
MRRPSRWAIVCCLTLEWLALGVWVGGLLVLTGAVIPAVFNTFGGQDSGGLFLTRAFERYNRFVIGAIAIMCGASCYRWRNGDRDVAVGRGEMMLLALMVGIAGVIIAVLHPHAASLQAQAFAAQGELERKVAFEALFNFLMPVRILYMVNLLLGVLLIGIKTKRSLYRDWVLS